ASVRAVMLLTILAIIIAVFSGFAGLIMAASSAGAQNNPIGPIVGIVLTFCSLGVLTLGVLYYRGMSNGVSGLWYIQIVLSIIGVLYGLLGLAVATVYE